MKKRLFQSIFTLLAVLSFSLYSSESQAQVTYTDTVCLNSQDVVYGISSADPGTQYTWYLSDPNAGTIDTTVTANNSQIEIDWSNLVGTYTLNAISQNANGCFGDTVSLNVVLNPLPTVAIVGDSICEDNIASLTFDFTGTAPWIVEYSDGSNTYTDTAAASPYVATLPSYSSTTSINVTNLSDANGCAADPSSLPSTTIFVYPKPSTGAIFHF